MNLIKISFKNIFRHKKRSFMLIGGIAFSTLIITFLDCFTGGLSYNIKLNNSAKYQGHIYIQGNYIEKDSSEKVILEAIEESGINTQSIARKNSIKANLIGNSRTISQEIIGIDYTGQLNIVQGESGGDKTIIMSESLSIKLDVAIGEYVTISTTTDTGQVNVEDFVLTALLKDEMDGEYFAYISLNDSNRLLDIEMDEYQSFNIYLESMEEMGAASNKLYTILKEKLNIYSLKERRKADSEKRSAVSGIKPRGYRGGRVGNLNKRGNQDTFIISTLEDHLVNVLDIVELMKNISKGIFIVLTLITMVGVSNTFRMIILERTSEIGTIRAVGMKKKNVLQLFQLEALFTSVIGVFTGIVIGALLMLISGFISIGVSEYQEFLNKGHLLFLPQAGSLSISIILLILFSNTAALRSSLKGANFKPAEALRYNL